MDSMSLLPGQPHENFLAELIPWDNDEPQGKARPVREAVTILGRNPNCSILLRGKGIEPLHCVLVQTDRGLELRDLKTPGGTFVNNDRIQRAVLRHGDLLSIGNLRFRIQLPASPVPDHCDSQPESIDAQASIDGLRIQAAAVAAQQAALDEQEARLVERKKGIIQQEQEIVAHLEERNRHLERLRKRVHNERTSLQKDRESYKKYLARMTGDLSEARAELQKGRGEVQNERRRLALFYQRFRRRWRCQRRLELKKQITQREELAREMSRISSDSSSVQEERKHLARRQLQLVCQYEFVRREIQHAWSTFRASREKWRRRRRLEKAALRQRARELEHAATMLAQAREHLLEEQGHAARKCRLLQQEADGLNNRINHLRDTILQYQDELARLEVHVSEHRGLLAATGESVNLPQPPSADATGAADAAEMQLQTRQDELQRFADALADQRLLLAEQWQVLLQVRQRWQIEHEQSAAELDTMAKHLHDQAHALNKREESLQPAEDRLRKRLGELTRMREYLQAWRARLRTREAAWQSERNHLLSQVRHREELVRNHFQVLAEARRRWSHESREELRKIRAEHEAANVLHQELVSLRRDWHDRLAELDKERRIAIEKRMAIEELQREVITKSANAPAAERRLERLRNRWIRQHRRSLHNLQRGHAALRQELAAMERRLAQYNERVKLAADAEAELAQKTSAWEQQRIQMTIQHARMRQALKIAQARRASSEQQLSQVHEEVERMARLLLAQAPAPSDAAADKAA
jgi:chromosome segregation ATPase